jgi:arabinofuranosyltransferase
MVLYFFSLPLGDPLLAAKVGGFIFGLCTLYLLPKLSYHLTNSFLPGFFVGLMLIFDFSFMAWIVSGLETALLSALLILTLYQIYRQGEPLLIGILVGLIAMTRPEGFGFLPLLSMGDGLIHRDKRRVVSILASFSLVFVPFLTWRFFRYGELLPVTVYAKSGSLTDQVIAGQVYLWQFLRAYRIPFTIGLISMIGLLVEFVHAPSVLSDWSLGISKERLKQAFLFLPLLFVLVGYSIFIVMAGGDWMPVFRFFAPLMPLVYLSITGILFLATQRAPTFIFYSLVILLLLRQLLFLSTIRTDVIARGQHTVTKLEKFGQWLQVNSDPTDVVAVLDAGAIPYYSGLKTIDIFGLNDATLPIFQEERDKRQMQIIFFHTNQNLLKCILFVHKMI